MSISRRKLARKPLSLAVQVLELSGAAPASGNSMQDCKMSQWRCLQFIKADHQLYPLHSCSNCWSQGAQSRCKPKRRRQCWGSAPWFCASTIDSLYLLSPMGRPMGFPSIDMVSKTPAMELELDLPQGRWFGRSKPAAVQPKVLLKVRKTCPKFEVFLQMMDVATLGVISLHRRQQIAQY